MATAFGRESVNQIAVRQPKRSRIEIEGLPAERSRFVVELLLRSGFAIRPRLLQVGSSSKPKPKQLLEALG